MPLIVVAGINGRQGTSVANAFLKVEGFRIRGLTSSPNCRASRDWKALGVEIREETFTEEEHVRTSFKEAAVIFVSTSYHKSFEDHRVNLAYEVGLIRSNIARFALERDILIGRTLLNAAAATPGLHRFVMSTLPVTLPGAKYASFIGQGNHMSKLDQISYLTRCLPGLLKKTIFVKPSLRMEDYHLTLRMDEAGNLSFGTTAPAHIPLHWTNMSEDFGMFVCSLLKLPLPSLAFAAYSDRASGEEICALISKISGRACQYQQYTTEEIKEFEKDIVSDLLPQPADSLLYEPNVFTPASIAELYNRHNDLIRETSFEVYLRAVLPGHVELLKNPTSKEQTSSIGAVNELRKRKQEDMERVPQVPPSDRLPRLETAITDDIFMGYPSSKMEEECVEGMGVPA